MAHQIRVLSLYEGFFAGGARVLHTDVVSRLHARGDQHHRVLSIASQARRESTIQPMADDPRFLRLRRDGVDVSTLGRTAAETPPDRFSYTERELAVAAEVIAEADVILSLKEQPLGLLLALHDHGMMPAIPVAACLHRSDPTHSGPALSWLAEAGATGLLTATISCAHSTDRAYAGTVSGVPQRFVITNGVDTDRFRPGTPDEIAATKRGLDIPVDAPIVMFAARFDAMKNPGLFLRSVAAHAARHPDTRYLLCGAGMARGNASFRALVEESGATGVRGLRPLGIRDDMPSLYQAADVVALTSAFGEASPLCLMEGAACGATPVTTHVGDAAREVEGIGIVTTDDAHEIAAAWTEVIARRDSLREAALAARPRLAGERMVQEYASAIDGLLRVQRAAA